MNPVIRGVRNALRTPLRSGAMIVMLAISIGLIVAMLVARTSVEAKITEVKQSAATTITIRPAGVMGGFGGGDPLTAEQVKKVTDTEHVASTIATLTDQLSQDDTSLTPSFELGQIGQRMQRFEGHSGGTMFIQGEGASPSSEPPKPRTTVTGTTNPNSVAGNGGELKLTSGKTFTTEDKGLVALLGKNLAEKNSLKVGDSFTAYGKTFTVQGIYETGNMFQDNGLIVPLSVLQDATSQPGVVTSLTAAIDSSDNVSSAVEALKTALGDKADITSDAERAAESVASLASISSLSASGVIGATVAAAVIVLLTMTLVVRERRREIGVIKAIGGSQWKVVSQFASEALTLTIIGGIIGLAIGIAASGSITQSLVENQQATPPSGPRLENHGSGGPVRMMAGPVGSINQGVRDVTSTITPDVFAIATACILLIAMIGSIVPAWLIARIRPAEVLRTE